MASEVEKKEEEKPSKQEVASEGSENWKTILFHFFVTNKILFAVLSSRSYYNLEIICHFVFGHPFATESLK